MDTNRSEQLAVEAIVAAWTDEGPAPEYHRMFQAKLRYEWPTLARAVEQLVEARAQ